MKDGFALTGMIGSDVVVKISREFIALAVNHALQNAGGALSIHAVAAQIHHNQ